MYVLSTLSENITSKKFLLAFKTVASLQCALKYFVVSNFEQEIKINLINKQTAFFVLHQKKQQKNFHSKGFKLLWTIVR